MTVITGINSGSDPVALSPYGYDDREMALLGSIIRDLNGINAAARRRIVIYLYSRYMASNEPHP
jgi:hypothetical protein